MIRRTFDPSEVNKVLSDPEVMKWIRRPHDPPFIDISPVLTNLNNIALMVDGGCILFSQQEPGIYEVHTNFRKEFRGSNAIRQSLAAYRWMFTRTDCMILQTKVPKTNEPAELFCRLVGAVKDFERQAVWPTHDGLVGMSYWSLKYEDWVRKTPSLMKAGKSFHERLEDELRRFGAAENHPDEDCHDLYVGACTETVYGGQPEKAVTLYNRWARFSDYAPISLLSLKPLIIDIATAVLLVENNSFTVIRCQQPH